MKRPGKIRILSQMLETNGLPWTAYASIYVFGRSLRRDLRVPWLDRRLREIERKQNVPGMGSSALQAAIWEAWDWESSRGEEWTESAAWKRSVIEDIMRPRLPVGSDVLEIGPGAGRWTGPLLELAGSLVLVDVSEACIAACRERFGENDNVDFILTSGSDLSGVEDGSKDVVWSFDVFVHIEPRDIAGYLSELNRVLRPGGQAIIHHADEEGLHGGWRSSMTRIRFAEMAGSAGLEVVEQFDSWGDSGRFSVRYYHDCITVARKPLQPSRSNDV